MLRWIGVISALLALSGTESTAEESLPPIELYRLDCGSITVKNLGEFSDTYLYTDKQKKLVASCYLIRHGEQLLLWDTGLDHSLAGTSNDSAGYVNALEESIVSQLGRIGLQADAVDFVGLSHYHFDHIGQAADFPRATLLIGKKDFEIAKGWKPAQQRLAPWISGSGKVRELTSDTDVFGDGRVTILSLPGHTEGHQALLVRLASGPVLLSGDQYHFADQIRNRGVPAFNTSRAETLASMDRFDRIAENLRAKVIIQHDPDDVAKLPIFPTPAR